MAAWFCLFVMHGIKIFSEMCSNINTLWPQFWSHVESRNDLHLPLPPPTRSPILPPTLSFFVCVHFFHNFLQITKFYLFKQPVALISCMKTRYAKLISLSKLWADSFYKLAIYNCAILDVTLLPVSVTSLALKNILPI
jgi:hypothetical protein